MEGPRFQDIEVTDTGFQGETQFTQGGWIRFQAGFPLFLIREAWDRHGVSFEDLADGFGPGQGTHDDWSGIRDSSPGAVNKMLERALNHLFHECERRDDDAF